MLAKTIAPLYKGLDLISITALWPSFAGVCSVARVVGLEPMAFLYKIKWPLSETWLPKIFHSPLCFDCSVPQNWHRREASWILSPHLTHFLNPFLLRRIASVCSTAVSSSFPHFGQTCIRTGRASGSVQKTPLVIPSFCSPKSSSVVP